MRPYGPWSCSDVLPAPPAPHTPLAAPPLMEDDEEVSRRPAAPDPAHARIGPFTAGAVLQALVYSGGAEGQGDEEAEADGPAALQVGCPGCHVHGYT